MDCNKHNSAKRIFLDCVNSPPVANRAPKLLAELCILFCLTFPSALRRIESDLMSLWMTPCEWRYASAFRHCLQTVAICSSSILSLGMQFRCKEVVNIFWTSNQAM